MACGTDIQGEGRARVPSRGVVSAYGDSGRMENFKVTWTGRDGKPRVSAVGYDKATAEQRKERLNAEEYDDVEVVEAKP